MASNVVSAPRSFRSGGSTAETLSTSHAPARCTGLGLFRLLATSGKMPVLVKRRNRRRRRVSSHPGGQPQASALGYRPAARGHQDDEQLTPRRARISSECNEPGSWPWSDRDRTLELSGAIEFGLHAWCPATRSREGQIGLLTSCGDAHRASVRRRYHSRLACVQAPTRRFRGSHRYVCAGQARSRSSNKQEREQQRCSTVQHTITECWKYVANPRNYGPGRDRRARVEELERGQNPCEQARHEADELVDAALRRHVHQHRAEVAEEEDQDADHQVHQHRQPGRDGHADTREHRDLEESQHQAGQAPASPAPSASPLRPCRRPTLSYRRRTCTRPPPRTAPPAAR